MSASSSTTIRVGAALTVTLQVATVSPPMTRETVASPLRSAWIRPSVSTSTDTTVGSEETNCAFAGAALPSVIEKVST